ncbi:MAG: GNAT family N-acetyltransferase [Pseudomonadota bacterium]
MLPDGTEIELRTMAAEDRDAMLAFAQSLPAEDLLFLRIDISQPDAVDGWIANIEAGSTLTLVAQDPGGIVGYATIHTNPLSWTRHVGEVRVNVSPAYRSRGLGRVLTGNVFDIAHSLRLKKLTAHMTSDQHGAQAAFRRLGFVPEALLADYVQDRNGLTRDMVIMSFDVDGLTDQAQERVSLD